MKIRETLEAYLTHFPEDTASLALLQDQLNSGEDVTTRKNFHGHVTAGGVVLNTGRTALLMIHHKAHDMWLQPGGHIEPGDADIAAAARREATEETGLRGIKQIVLFDDPSVPIVIETQYIPARPDKDEPEHYHHDMWYLFEADSTETTALLEEVHAAEWVQLDDARTQSVALALSRMRDLRVI